jgi:hypothetical protein
MIEAPLDEIPLLNKSRLVDRLLISKALAAMAISSL